MHPWLELFIMLFINRRYCHGAMVSLWQCLSDLEIRDPCKTPDKVVEASVVILCQFTNLPKFLPPFRAPDLLCE